MISVINHTGNKVQLTDNKISNILFINFINKITYYQTYYHPEMWSNEKRDHVQSENFIPLLKIKMAK